MNRKIFKLKKDEPQKTQIGGKKEPVSEHATSEDIDSIDSDTKINNIKTLFHQKRISYNKYLDF